MRPDFPKVYHLKGSTDVGNADRRISLLTTLLERARARGSEVAQLRQRNLNFALIIFAGILTFSLQFASSSKWYSLWVSGALVIIMVFFSLLDRRFHRYSHGWRGTETKLMHTIASVINEPDQDVTFLRYDSKSERKAERLGLQPCITYALTVAAAVHLVYSVWCCFRQ